ncbi:HPr kinase/phosphatase C-terminal domain-containing protein [Sphingomonas qilianensis]|uniref:HPr kinase/phosphatase C-terminal domain-containing protein n=1 Tax=Sphingomonas qilianensis TaxID=1736690 RepID=A0ABU9XMS2_9SPHN
MSDAYFSETLHASTVAIGGRAVLIEGRSGAGKSDLALRLIDRGARLISDDYTVVARDGDRLLASAPATIRGQMEVRGLGIIAVDTLAVAPIALLVRLDDVVERLPEHAERVVGGLRIPLVTLNGLEASAPIKVELALARTES